MGLSLMGVVGGVAGFLIGGPAGAAVGYGLGSGTDAAQEQNEMLREQADRQMAFQQRNSDTAYQRAVMDMRKAGLNPMLAYSQGGASTPSGAQAQGLESPTGRGVSTALQAGQVYQGMQNLQADTGLKKAQILKEAAVAQQSVSSANQAEAQTAQLKLESMDRAMQIKQDARRAGYDATMREVDSVIKGTSLQRDADAFYDSPAKQLRAVTEEAQNRARSSASDVKRAAAEAEIRRSQVYRSQRDESYERDPWGGKYERYIPDFGSLFNSAGSVGLRYRGE